MRNAGIGSWPARRARKTPGAVAVVQDDVRRTYGELYERVCRLAHGLRGLGVRRGDRVAYLGANHPAFLETLFATGALGAVFVPLNTRLAGPELAYCLADSGASVLIAAPDLADAVDATRDAASVRHRVDLDGPGADSPGYEELLASAPADPLDEPVTLDDPCLIMYTSGTTGRPKGAVLTHGNITWNSLNVLVDIDLTADEVTLVTAPMFHTAALNMTCLPTLLKGGTLVLMAAFDPVAALAAITGHQVTYMFGVPTMYDAIAACPEWPDADLSSLRQVNCGGAPVPPATIATYTARGLVFSQGYGMTEAAPGVLYLSAADSAAKAGTAGVPHFFTDVHLTGPDGRPTGPGEPGEIQVSGPNVMPGYWNRPEATAQALTDGWFHSGDIATADTDGYVAIIDRIKDVIISGGENIYPAEVETALQQHPDVAECAVIGVPDPRWGETGRAIIVPRPGTHPAEADLIAFLQNHLAHYKIPKTVVFTDALPRNPTGKILKKTLRERHGA